MNILIFTLTLVIMRLFPDTNLILPELSPFHWKRPKPNSILYVGKYSYNELYFCPKLEQAIIY